MPVTSQETVVVALQETRVNRWKIAKWEVDHTNPLKDVVRVTLHIGEADAQGQVLYQFWKHVTIEGVALAMMMAAAAQKIHDRVAAAQHPAMAHYHGTKEALYEGIQALGELPAGAQYTLE